MSGKYTYLFTLELNDKLIDFYQSNTYLTMKIDNISQYFIKGITIENNIIYSKVIINNSYVYLPDIEYINNNSIIEALIARDKYITQLENTNSTNLCKKKNLPLMYNNLNIINVQ
jgi:hypothetical protein